MQIVIFSIIMVSYNNLILAHTLYIASAPLTPEAHAIVFCPLSNANYSAYL